jgi:acylphosphatase
VGFRVTAREIASELGLTGHVRNVDDGSVEALATGAADRLDRFVDQLQSRFSLPIHDIQSWPVPLGEHSGDSGAFEIRY